MDAGLRLLTSLLLSWAPAQPERGRRPRLPTSHPAAQGGGNTCCRAPTQQQVAPRHTRSGDSLLPALTQGSSNRRCPARPRAGRARGTDVRHQTGQSGQVRSSRVVSGHGQVQCQLRIRDLICATAGSVLCGSHCQALSDFSKFHKFCAS